MERTIKILIVTIIWLTSSVSHVTAQTPIEKSPIPLYLEASLDVSTPYKGSLPFEQTLDVNYAIK
ncbi:MAG: hypothetical protein K2H96_07100, partial [Muribaculaceae bacterium]|nr:hypothetical protein [Muribaculaceae bacterium]